ncbi:MAG: hypothetical protein EOP53_09505 [Sphingobacteriales bacterium]|nr:MAG: hypothetical protein EOP53_09505 [Sphingobacteriales bacterium]
MEILIAILIYIGVLSAGTPYTPEMINNLEIQNRARIEQVRNDPDFQLKYITRDKTVWDHEEL